MGKPSAPPKSAPGASAAPGASQRFCGTYERGVDGSLRTLLPSEWRALGETRFLLVVWPLVGPAEYLRALPPGSAAKLHAKLEDLPLSDPQGTVLARAVASRSYEISLDRFGRLPIPEPAARAVGIQDKVSLVGEFTRFELWNPDRYAEAMARPENIAQVQQALDSRSI